MLQRFVSLGPQPARSSEAAPGRTAPLFAPRMQRNKAKKKLTVSLLVRRFGLCMILDVLASYREVPLARVLQYRRGRASAIQANLKKSTQYETFRLVWLELD